MHPALAKEARRILKVLLVQCTEGEQLIFKRMYSHKNLDVTIDEVVDNMDEDKMDWAITQCEHTVKQKKPKKKGIVMTEKISPVTGNFECEDCSNTKKNGWSSHCKTCGQMIEESLTYCPECYQKIKERKKKKGKKNDPELINSKES